jgi:hypothetical protein
MHQKYAIVFSNDMQRPLIIIVDSREKLIYQIRDVMEKYGEFELIYRVY